MSDHSADKRHGKRKRTKAKAPREGLPSARPSVSYSLQPRPARRHEWNPVDPDLDERFSSEDEEEEHGHRPNPNLMRPAERRAPPAFEGEEHPYRLNPNLMRPAERRPLPASQSSSSQPLRRRLPQDDDTINIPYVIHTDPPPAPHPSHTASPPASHTSQRRSTRGATAAYPATDSHLKTNR